VGGLRIKQIKSSANTGKPIIKLFKYGENGGESGVSVNYPTMDKFMTENKLIYPKIYREGINSATGQTVCGYIPVPNVYARKRTFFSTPNKEINYFDTNPVWYPYTEEIQVDEDGNPLGKTIYRYEMPQEDEYDQVYA